MSVIVSEAGSLDDILNNQEDNLGKIPVSRLIEGKWQNLYVNNKEFEELMAMAERGELDENTFQIGWFVTSQQDISQLDTSLSELVIPSNEILAPLDDIEGQIDLITVSGPDALEPSPVTLDPLGDIEGQIDLITVSGPGAFEQSNQTQNLAGEIEAQSDSAAAVVASVLS